MVPVTPASTADILSGIPVVSIGTDGVGLSDLEFQPDRI
jgi:hypothetical protein